APASAGHPLRDCRGAPRRADPGAGPLPARTRPLYRRPTRRLIPGLQRSREARLSPTPSPVPPSRAGWRPGAPSQETTMLDILSTEMAPPDEGRLVQMDADTYYADPCPEPSLSQSIAHVLLAKSPLHAWLQHPRLGGKARAATKAMDEGSLVHALLLGQDDQIVEVDADSWRTNAAKEQRDAARAEGKIPVLAGELDDVRTAVNAIRL